MEAQKKQAVCPFQSAHAQRTVAKQDGQKIINAVKPFLFDKQGNKFVAKANPDKGAALKAVEDTGVDAFDVVAGLKHANDQESATVYAFVKDVTDMIRDKDRASTVSGMANYMNVAQDKKPKLVVG